MDPRQEVNEGAAKGRAPVDVERIARVIDREEVVETVKDAFGSEHTRRQIRQRIMEVETKRGGDTNDLAGLDDDSMVDRFIEQRGYGQTEPQP